MTEPKKFLSRAEIDKVKDRPTGDHYVKEWAGWVRIRAMSAKQRSTVTSTFVAVDGADVKMRADEISDVQLLTVASCLIDHETGVSLYGPDELAEIGGKNAGAVEGIYAALQTLSGLDEDAIDEAEANFDETPSEPSPSD